MSPSYLPPEIWMIILSHHSSYCEESYAAIHSLSLVSQRFRTLAQPFLFRNISIDPHAFYVRSITHARRRIEVLSDRIEGLLDLMDRRSEALTWVKTLRVDLKEDNDKWMALGEIRLRIEPLILRMARLSSLSLRGTFLSRDIYTQLHRLPTLRSFSYDVSQAGDILALENDVQRLQVVDNLSIENLDISGYSYTSTVGTLLTKLALAPKLKELSISGHGNRNPFLISLFALAQATPPPPFQHLTRVRLLLPTDLDVDAFKAFFACCKNVIDLDLYHYHNTYRDPTRPNNARLPPCELEWPLADFTRRCEGILPQLEKLGSHPHYCHSVMRGRPVHDLRVCYTSHNPRPWGNPPLCKRELQIFTVGAAAVSKLWLEGPTWRDGCLDDIADLFPHLKSLQLTNVMNKDPEPWLLEHGLPFLERMTVLETLHIECVPRVRSLIKPEERQPFLSGIAAVNSSLQDIDLGRGCNQWKRKDGGRWEKVKSTVED